LKDAWRDRNGNVIRIAIYWQKEDVLETAKEMKIKLTDEEVSEVLETVLDSHDAMFGINWDNIKCAIAELESLQQLKRGF
jgi:hypothetical protein